jgi:DNA-binding transcriptional LysR family regulator
MRWDDVEVLLAVARGRTLDAAAGRLEVDAATVSRRLRALEEELGVVLFDRTRTGLRPTAALENLVPLAEGVEQAFGAFVSGAEGFEAHPEGTVRVTAPPLLAQQFIAPRIPTLLARAPRLELELLVDQRVLDFGRREADLALRTVRPESGDLVCQQLRALRPVVAAAPSLLAGRRPVAAWSELPWIGWDSSMASQPLARFLAAEGLVARVRSNSAAVHLEAARAGVGAVIYPDVVVKLWGLAEVPLAPPLRARLAAVPEDELWLVTHRALRRIPRVDAVWRWLVEEGTGDWTHPAPSPVRRRRARAGRAG